MKLGRRHVLWSFVAATVLHAALGATWLYPLPPSSGVVRNKLAVRLVTLPAPDETDRSKEARNRVLQRPHTTAQLRASSSTGAELHASARRADRSPSSRVAQQAAATNRPSTLARPRSRPEKPQSSSASQQEEASEPVGRALSDQAAGSSSDGVNADQLHTDYRRLLASWLARNKTYPLTARRMGIEDEVIVRIRIDRSGRVLARVFTKPGRYAILKQAAERMVERSDPFPPVPPELPGDVFEFSVPIRFRLEDG